MKASVKPSFLVDENISFRIARALDALSRFDVLSVVDHERLGRESDDVEDIIEVCQDEDHLLVLNDWKIRQKSHEKAALLESEIGAFFAYLGKKQQPKFWKQARIFVERWRLVEEYALNNRTPFSAMIHWRKKTIEDLRRST